MPLEGVGHFSQHHLQNPGPRAPFTLSLRQSCCCSLPRVRCCGQNYALACAVPLGDHLATSIPEVAGNGPIGGQSQCCGGLLVWPRRDSIQRPVALLSTSKNKPNPRVGAWARLSYLEMRPGYVSEICVCVCVPLSRDPNTKRDYSLKSI